MGRKEGMGGKEGGEGKIVRGVEREMEAEGEPCAKLHMMTSTCPIT